MTKQWTRTAPLQGVPEKVTMETWTYGDLVCPVEVTIGKPLDVRGLKNTSLEEIKEYSAFLKKTAKNMRDSREREHFVGDCPACTKGADFADIVLTVFHHTYVQCYHCGHGFITWQAPQSVASDSDEHAAPYVDRASLEVRMKQVIEPKVDWTLRQYTRLRGKKPLYATDVGAGGGHFVAGMRKHTKWTWGHESNSTSRRFAREAFDVDLSGDVWLTEPTDAIDLVTMWGLLEYVSEPRKFLEQAHNQLRRDGMLIVEIPRLDCFGTAVQREMPEYVARHMDPTSHMNAFTEASICTALVETGFKPVAAWYFGMDMYELLTQMAIRDEGENLFEYFAPLIPALQASLDRGRECDDIVIAAVPL